MATQKVREDSPLVLYESDEVAGRKAFNQGLSCDDCPFPSDKGNSIRRLAWMRGFMAEKYWSKHQTRNWKDYV